MVYIYRKKCLSGENYVFLPQNVWLCSFKRAHAVLMFYQFEWIFARFHSGDFSEPQSPRRAPPAVLLQPKRRAAARHRDAARRTAAAGNWSLLVRILNPFRARWAPCVCAEVSLTHCSFSSTGLLLWPRNGAAAQSGFAWTLPRSPLWPETAGPSWDWGWPSTGSPAGGPCVWLPGLCLWPFRPWDCTTSIDCRCRSDHQDSSTGFSLSNLSWCLRLWWCLCPGWFTWSLTGGGTTKSDRPPSTPPRTIASSSAP